MSLNITIKVFPSVPNLFLMSLFCEMPHTTPTNDKNLSMFMAILHRARLLVCWEMNYHANVFNCVPYTLCLVLIWYSRKQNQGFPFAVTKCLPLNSGNWQHPSVNTSKEGWVIYCRLTWPFLFHAPRFPLPSNELLFFFYCCLHPIALTLFLSLWDKWLCSTVWC